MNLESQIVIFSCNQRTVKKLSCQFQEEKIYGKMQKRNNNRSKKKLYIQNTSGKP